VSSCHADATIDWQGGMQRTPCLLLSCKPQLPLYAVLNTIYLLHTHAPTPLAPSCWYHMVGAAARGRHLFFWIQAYHLNRP
jgi:hypothetical protein